MRRRLARLPYIGHLFCDHESTKVAVVYNNGLLGIECEDCGVSAVRIPRKPTSRVGGRKTPEEIEAETAQYEHIYRDALANIGESGEDPE